MDRPLFLSLTFPWNRINISVLCFRFKNKNFIVTKVEHHFRHEWENDKSKFNHTKMVCNDFYFLRSFLITSKLSHLWLSSVQEYQNVKAMAIDREIVYGIEMPLKAIDSTYLFTSRVSGDPTGWLTVRWKRAIEIQWNCRHLNRAKQRAFTFNRAHIE